MSTTGSAGRRWRGCAFTRKGRRSRKTRRVALVALFGLSGFAGLAAASEQLVFGSFRSEDHAARWAVELGGVFGREFFVERIHREDGVWYRVRSGSLSASDRDALEAAAAARDLDVWVIRGSYESPETVTSSSRAPAAAILPEQDEVPGDGEAERAGYEHGDSVATRSRGGASAYADFDLGLQTRTYPRRGTAGQDRFQPSMSARLEYHRSWDDDRASLTFTPFVRLDGDDDERTHADVRELFLSRVGDTWELHIGARQVFWGVTEFHHLVDVVNQTDLVENIDGEDKLGQPMAQLSLVRDWGIIDLFAMSGFRERTFPGEDGRLRSLPRVDTDRARYVSAAGRSRVDGAVRWSHHVGPVSFAVHHFSCTGRDPQFVPEVHDGELILVPEYHVIDQTGFDGQAILGDWAWKLEAMTRSGHGDRYFAYTAGFERTLVGVLGTRGDLGLVMEYMYDERDDKAFDTLFEHDLAIGTRWRANDLADTTALAGIIWDVETDEYVVTLEASRRLGASWLAVLEGRIFGGARSLGSSAAAPSAADLMSRALKDDDFIQLELTRFF